MSKTGSIIALCALLSTALGCAKMLGLEQEDEDHAFEHRAHLVEGINCLKCHAGIPEAGETGPLHFPSTADCVECHQEPHNTNTCSDCHGRARNRQAAEMARKHLRFSHAVHQEEGAGDCVRCHVNVTTSSDYVRVKHPTCFSCHAHKGQWDTRDCGGCHVDLPGEMTRPESHVIHDGNFLREHGVEANAQGDLCTACHTQRQCAACHGITVPAIPSRLNFDEPMRNTMHRANFISVHDQQAVASPAQCLICHSELFCVDCHTRLGISGQNPERGSPHPPGWSGPPGTSNTHGRAARLDPLSCASCHGGAGEMLCVGCHIVGGPGGNPHPPGFNSRLDTANDLPCRLCHIGGR
ncbi:MAG TPA: hypothetical protein VFG22_01500 [Polyangiales bacterium]|nr:hypothetical protein [Polyangiales bacterium]